MTTFKNKNTKRVLFEKKTSKTLVAGYQLEKKTPFGQWEKVSETPIIGETATVPDLTEGEEYEYRVAAVTDAGVGEFSNATPPTKAERKKRAYPVYSIHQPRALTEK